jgi:1A family penicillin-binding protein
MNDNPEDMIGTQQDTTTDRAPDALNDTHPSLGDASRNFGAALWRAVSEALQIVWTSLLRFLRMAFANFITLMRATGSGLRSFHCRWRAKVAQRAAWAVNSAHRDTHHSVAGPTQDLAKVPRRQIRIGRVIGGFALLTLFMTSGGFALYAAFTMPGLNSMRINAENSLIFEDAAGNPLLTSGAVPSVYANEASIPKMLRQAVIAIEDRRFYNHGAVELRSVLRAAVNNFRSGGVVEGGSTISQQFVKITYLDPERSFRRKFHEAILAYQLERRFTKDEILTRYLNAVYLGAGATGMPAAAHVYFSTDLASLSLAQAAALAAMIRAPSAVNPFSDLDALRKRASLVLDRMVAEGFVSGAEADAARAELATMTPLRPDASYGTWFSDWVLAEADRMSSGFDGVVTLRTTLDPVAQKLAENAVSIILENAGVTSEAALISMTPEGEIVAMVGGRYYADSQFNRATDALRSPGSTFKTIVYLTALMQGFSPNDRVRDEAVDIDGYQPQNFGGRFHGEVSLSDAFAQSMNAATVRVAMAVGLDKVIETARILGIEAELSATPSLALGASGVTLLDLTEAYASLATGRLPVKARGISGLKSGEDNSFYKFKWPAPELQPGADRVMLARAPMIYMLRQVIDEGTGKNAALPGGAFGKTGTSQDFRDAMFIGWNEKLITGVWVGNDDNSPMDGITGGALPAQIWQRFMFDAASDQSDAAAVSASAAPPEPGEASLALTATSEVGAYGPTCNIRTCERFYRSFRASDCTYQPYRGSRTLCTR